MIDEKVQTLSVATREASLDSRFVRALAGDHSGDRRPRDLPGVAYSLVQPSPVSAPRLLAWSDRLGAELGIARPQPGPDGWLAVLAGNRWPAGSQPYAARYGGHQFGQWAGQLGDGRAVTLGEWTTPAGASVELQLKGAGPTPYSRHADGRAVLRSSLREFLCSEAMHHLGVPTTRALSLVATGDSVLRDLFYDGHPALEPGAIVCRVAPSFLRFGNFEIHAAGGEQELLVRLLDTLIANHYPSIDPVAPDRYAQCFVEICRRTALLIAHWQRVGFVHGVMNTDNMSALGLSIDYGPYGWLEGFDPLWTPNTTDAQGRRYCFGRQPEIAAWNLSRLGGALLSLVDRESLEAGLDGYRDEFNAAHRRMSAHKLGLATLDDEADQRLYADLLGLLAAVETDYSLFFRQLARVEMDAAPHAPAAPGGGCAALIHPTAAPHAPAAPLAIAFYDPAGLAEPHQQRLDEWLVRYQQRLQAQGIGEPERRARMDAVNPKYLARNYLAQLAIDAAAEGDMAPLLRMLRVLENPYTDQPGADDLAAPRPEWARHRAGCSALSCSS